MKAADLVASAWDGADEAERLGWATAAGVGPHVAARTAGDSWADLGRYYPNLRRGLAEHVAARAREALAASRCPRCGEVVGMLHACEPLPDHLQPEGPEIPTDRPPARAVRAEVTLPADVCRDCGGTLVDVEGMRGCSCAPRCPDGLLPDGESCPRCGGPRAPSGVGGGTWVHVADRGDEVARLRAQVEALREGPPTSLLWRLEARLAELLAGGGD